MKADKSKGEGDVLVMSLLCKRYDTLRVVMVLLRKSYEMLRIVMI